MSARAALLASLAAAGLGLLLVALGAFLWPVRTAFAWHAAFLFGWTLVMGLLGWVLIHHCTNSSWFIVLRRVAELGTAPLLLLVLLFLPVVASAPVLFPWWEPAHLEEASVREAVHKVRAYLNPPFFLVRAALYFGIWLAAALLLARWSRAQEQPDADAGALARRQRIFAAAAIIPFAFAVHFAAVDWVMSLHPAWTSSVFGVLVFAGGLVGALALLVLATAGLARGEVGEVVGVSHVHGLGKLLFTLVCFWAYIQFFQFLIIWIADEPSEVAWFLPRTSGAWQPLAVLLVFGHFVLPFFALFSRELKRRRTALAGVAGWILVFHALDVYWLVMPAHAPHDATPHLVDLGAFLAVGGLAVAFVLWRGRRVPLLARGDPRFLESVRFETQ